MSIVVVGADIGQKHDPSAIVVVEYQTVELTPTGEPRPDPYGTRDYFAEAIGWQEPPPRETLYVVRTIDRLPLNTSYPAVARRINAICRRLHNRDPQGELYLIVDQTGVGRPVVEMIEAELEPFIHLTGATFNGTNMCDPDPLVRTEISVGKAYMVSRLQVVLQKRTLQMPKTPTVAQLVTELTEYEIRISQTGHDSYGAFTVGTYDDLVTALGLACLGECHTQVTYGPKIY